MADLLDVPRTVTARLDRARVPYMLSGSIAPGYYVGCLARTGEVEAVTWPTGDAAPEAAATQRRLLRARTSDERIAMLVAMWRDAVSIVESRLIAEGVVEPSALRVRLFRQIYASDSDARTLDRIAARLAAAPLGKATPTRD
jgi:hypothetical protein